MGNETKKRHPRRVMNECKVFLIIFIQKFLLSIQPKTEITQNTYLKPASVNRVHQGSERKENRVYSRSFLNCGLLLSLRSLHSVAVAVGIATIGASLGGSAGPLLIIPIVIIIFIHIHLPRSRLVSRRLFGTSRLLLDLSRRRSRLRSV